jgi:4-amino-4-deoxy-L-arabinose transferase-like glycosyltransferase
MDRFTTEGPVASLAWMLQQVASGGQAFAYRLGRLATRSGWAHSSWVEAVCLLGMALGLNLIGNDRTSLWDRDEPRYAQCAREMRDSGDYLRPSFNGEPRNHKPVLSYWLIQAGVAIGGDTPFGNRLMSAVCGAATCLMVWHIGRRMFGATVGRIAGFVMTSAPLVIIESKLATTDAPLAFFLTLTAWSVWELVQRRSARWAAVFWVSLAGTILIKGPVGPGFLASSALVAWLVGGRPRVAWGRLRMRWGIPLLVGLTAPWYVAIGWLTRGEFFRVALGQQLLARAAHGIETHGGFPGYYLAATLLAFFPWSVFLPLAAPLLWQNRKAKAAFSFLAGWIVGPLLVLEVFHTKLIHYYLPAMGGCALVVAWALEQIALSERNLRRWRLGRLALGLLMGMGLTLSVILTAALWILPAGLRLPSLAIAVVIGATVLLSAEQFHRAAGRRAWPLLAAGTAASFVLLSGWLLPNLERYRLTPKVASRLAEVCRETSAHAMLWTFQPPGVVYDFGQRVLVRRDEDWMMRQVRDKGALAAPLFDWEVVVLERDPRLTLDRHGSVSGINVESGRTQTLEMVVIRPAATSLLDRPGADLALGQQPLVK